MGSLTPGGLWVKAFVVQPVAAEAAPVGASPAHRGADLLFLAPRVGVEPTSLVLIQRTRDKVRHAGATQDRSSAHAQDPAGRPCRYGLRLALGVSSDRGARVQIRSDQSRSSRHPGATTTSLRTRASIPSAAATSPSSRRARSAAAPGEPASNTIVALTPAPFSPYAQPIQHRTPVDRSPSLRRSTRSSENSASVSSVTRTPHVIPSTTSWSGFGTLKRSAMPLMIAGTPGVELHGTAHAEPDLDVDETCGGVRHQSATLRGGPGGRARRLHCAQVAAPCTAGASRSLAAPGPPPS